MSDTYECISDRTSLTACGDNTCSHVMGQMPPLASVDAITATVSQFTSSEQSCDKRQIHYIFAYSWNTPGTDLKVEIHHVFEDGIFGETFMFLHEICDSIVPVSSLSFREESRVAEPQMLTTRHGFESVTDPIELLRHEHLRLRNMEVRSVKQI